MTDVAATHDEIGEVVALVAVPVLLLFPVGRERVVVVLRVPHLRAEIEGRERGGRAPTRASVHLEPHQCVPLVPARWNVGDTPRLLLPVL